MNYGFPPPPAGVDRTDFFNLAGLGLVVAAALLIAALVKGMKVRRMIGRSDVSVVEGRLQKARRLDGSSRDIYTYHIGNQTFDYIPSKAWHAVTHGIRYRVYFRDKDLLSIEPG